MIGVGYEIGLNTRTTITPPRPPTPRAGRQESVEEIYHKIFFTVILSSADSRRAVVECAQYWDSVCPVSVDR